MFTKGFKKKQKREADQDEQTPANEMMNGPALRNVSGSDKVAAAGGSLLQAPKAPSNGMRAGLKTMSSPKRVTPDLSPYGAPKGASGVTGVSNSHPFQHSYGKFGRRPRQALKSFTRLKKGM